MFIAVIGFLVVGLLVGEIAYELKTGKLVGRSWKVYAHRQDNPMLYWSSVILEAMLALLLLGIWLLAVLGSSKPPGI